MPLYLGKDRIAASGLGNIPVSNITQAGLNIGDFFQGGYVFYFNDATKKSGLIMTPNLPDQYVWGCGGTSISTSNTIGTGQSNTNNILAGCATRPIAASVADSYSINGYSDWYLGSLNEMIELMNASIIYGSYPFNIIRSEVIQTSSQASSTLNNYVALAFNNLSYSTGQANKSAVSGYVIPIRSFSL